MPTISYGRFPARVTLPDGTEVNRSAVVVADGRATLVVQASRQHHEPPGVRVVAELDVVFVDTTQRRKMAVLRSADGQEWTVTGGDGCGCRGNPVHAWFKQQYRGATLGT